MICKVVVDLSLDVCHGHRLVPPYTLHGFKRAFVMGCLLSATRQRSSFAPPTEIIDRHLRGRSINRLQRSQTNEPGSKCEPGSGVLCDVFAKPPITCRPFWWRWISPGQDCLRTRVEPDPSAGLRQAGHSTISALRWLDEARLLRCQLLPSWPYPEVSTSIRHSTWVCWLVRQERLARKTSLHHHTLTWTRCWHTHTTSPQTDSASKSLHKLSTELLANRNTQHRHGCHPPILSSTRLIHEYLAWLAGLGSTRMGLEPILPQASCHLNTVGSL